MNLIQALKLCNYENAKIFAEQVKYAAIDRFPHGQREDAIKFAKKLIDYSETVGTSTKVFLGFTVAVIGLKVYCSFKFKSINQKAQEIFNQYPEEHSLHRLRSKVNNPLDFLPSRVQWYLMTTKEQQSYYTIQANSLLRKYDYTHLINPNNDEDKATKQKLENDAETMSELRGSKNLTESLQSLGRISLLVSVISAAVGIYHFKEMKNLDYFPQALELFKTRAAYAPPIFN